MEAASDIDFDEALKRLNRSLDRLEASAMRRAAEQRSAVTVQEAITALKTDRARLAEELDAALAKVARLEETCAGATRRIDQAVSSVRGVIQRAGREAH